MCWFQYEGSLLFCELSYLFDAVYYLVKDFNARKELSRRALLKAAEINANLDPLQSALLDAFAHI